MSEKYIPPEILGIIDDGPKKNRDGKPERSEFSHIPEGLRLQQEYAPGHVPDERGFLQFDPSVNDPDFFERQVAERYDQLGAFIFDEAAKSGREDKRVQGLIESLGRVPTPAEVAREAFRLRLLRQVGHDLGFYRPDYYQAEEGPQRAVIEKRQADFPKETGLEEFENGPARIEKKNGVTRLIITTQDAEGRKFDHPVMTTEELDDWVGPSAEMIARSIGKNKKDARVFIAGLGLGLLNRELSKLGIKNHVVAELNHEVIDLVGEPLKEEDRDLNLDIRQGDFKRILQEAITNEEQFDAISIDAFPNSAEEVNRDASSDEVLDLTYRALKPGGTLTFYPDSRYIPARILKPLHDMGIPDSSIHYTMGKFHTSKFTRGYHYGELMSVPCVKKPVLSDMEQVRELERQYYKNRNQQIEEYVARHLGHEVTKRKAA